MNKLKNNNVNKLGLIIILILMITTIAYIYLSDYSYKYYAFIAAFFELIIGLIVIAIINNKR